MREPDFVIGGKDRPYLRRWYIIPRNHRFNIYLHHFKRSDDDRAMHDHPWWNVSVLLKGAYWEVVPGGKAYRRAPQIVWRRATRAHRIELNRDQSGAEVPVWTLFITGPKVREWGFLCPKGWRHWRDFVSLTDRGAKGPGCD